MGTFNATMEIANLNQSEYVEFTGLVDTGSTHTTVPESLLHRLRVTPVSSRRFQLADGRVVEYHTGFAWVRYNGDQAVVQVVFAPEDVGASIGATTLENLNLGIDPNDRSLMPVNNLMRRHGTDSTEE